MKNLAAKNISSLLKTALDPIARILRDRAVFGSENAEHSSFGVGRQISMTVKSMRLSRNYINYCATMQARRSTRHKIGDFIAETL
jgi:hypothetical protein